ncbi:hypothetical protein [Ideonella sp.]|uniref:hypothetical protein n=1 Tax=Ideonella sp. TaxID=1929293 RepID=UPI0035B3BCCE
MLDAATRLCRIGFELRGALIREGQPLDYDTMHAALLRADVAVTDLGCAIHGDEQGAGL